MTTTISLRGLTRRYGEHRALDDVSVEFPDATITGLLGRNGASKSTMMRIIAGQEFPTEGTVAVFGASPWENDEVLRRMVFVREDQAFPDFRVRHAVRAASWVDPRWDPELAERLMAEFDLPPNRAVKRLSRGMRSALSIVIGLAARAELTLFDEPYAGLDPVARRVFYDRLLADYAAFPRTIVLSTHLIDEAADLLERVVMIDHGRVVLDASSDDIRGSAVAISGPAGVLDDFVAGRITWSRRQVASHASVVVAGEFGPAEVRRARDLSLNLEPLSLQQLVVEAANRAVEERTLA